MGLQRRPVAGKAKTAQDLARTAVSPEPPPRQRRPESVPVPDDDSDELEEPRPQATEQLTPERDSVGEAGFEGERAPKPLTPTGLGQPLLTSPGRSSSSPLRPRSTSPLVRSPERSGGYGEAAPRTPPRNAERVVATDWSPSDSLAPPRQTGSTTAHPVAAAAPPPRRAPFRCAVFATALSLAVGGGLWLAHSFVVACEDHLWASERCRHVLWAQEQWQRIEKRAGEMFGDVNRRADDMYGNEMSGVAGIPAAAPFETQALSVAVVDAVDQSE